jgi:hypothetical protein
MLRLIRKHLAACKKTSEKDWKCVPKVERTRVSCPFYVAGPDPRDRTAPAIKKHTKTSDERIAKDFLLRFELSLYENPKPEPAKTPPPKTLDEAVEHYLGTKKRKSKPRQQKLTLQMSRMVAYLKETFNRRTVRDVEKTDLEAFMNSWVGEDSTLRTTRENMKGFWLYCYESEFTSRNIAAKLPTIGDLRTAKVRRIPTFSHTEIEAIIIMARTAATDGVLYQREGQNVARQVLAFTLVEKYTGMAIGDVTKLRLDELSGNTLLVNRKKTGEPVFTALPDFAVAALHAFKADSPEYFFWSGEGELHTRTSKWHTRLQKLYASAGVRVSEVERRKRSGGKLKGNTEKVKISEASPHWWRHTFVRDCYLRRPHPVPLETIADLIGDDVDTVRKYYSSFDELRQEQLKAEMELMWSNDPLTQRLTADHASSGSPAESTTRE